MQPRLPMCKRSATRSAALLGAALALAFACNPALAEDDNCNLPLPPLDAQAARVEGAYFFVFPAMPTATYNGCQTIWYETKEKLFVGKFRDGRLVEIDLSPKSDAALPPESKCVYAEGALTSGGDRCPDYADFKTGLQYSLAKDLVTTVPPGRDIRTKPDGENP